MQSYSRDAVPNFIHKKYIHEFENHIMYFISSFVHMFYFKTYMLQTTFHSPPSSRPLCLLASNPLPLIPLAVLG